MSSLYLQFHVYRSNPIMIRFVAVPENFMVGELKDLVPLAFGLDPALYYRQVTIESDPQPEEDPENCTLLPEMNGTVRLAKDSQTIKFLSLDIFWTAAKKREEEISCPVLKEGRGYDLPSGIFNIFYVNEMQAAFIRDSNYQIATGEVLYYDQLQINKKKINNAICRKYAPEKATDQVHMELALPLKDLIDSATLADIRYKLESIHHYEGSGEKKAYYVSVLTKRMEETYAGVILGQMEPQEYAAFRLLVLKGKSSCQSNEDLQLEFPVLWDNCRIRYIKKQGIRISRDVLFEYEQWCDEIDVNKFSINKKIRTAMHWCAFYYGIFSISHCYQVIQTVYPGEISQEDLSSYWEKTPDFAAPLNIRFTGKSILKHSPEDYAYDTRILTEEQSLLFVQALQKDSSQRKLPESQESFAYMAKKSTLFVSEEETQKLFSYSSYYSYETSRITEKLNEAIHLMRRGVDPETAFSKTRKNIYWGYGESRNQKLILDFLKEQEDFIPHFLYYGFTREEIIKKKIHSYLNDNYLALKQEIEEQKKLEKKARFQTTARTSSVKRRKS